MNAKPFSIERLAQSIKSISLKLQLKLKAVLILPFLFHVLLKSFETPVM